MEHTERNYLYEDNGVFTLAVQDRFKYGVEDKWAAFTAKPSKETDVTLSFLSTVGNWIVVDFGNAELAKHIIEAN